MDQLQQATFTDPVIADAFSAVWFMAAHPSILAEPALLERALRANGTVSSR